MRVSGNSKGYARNTVIVKCYQCGTNCDLHFDNNSDQFICKDCIDLEQNVIDDKEHPSCEDDGINDWNDNYGQELDRRNK